MKIKKEITFGHFMVVKVKNQIIDLKEGIIRLNEALKDSANAISTFVKNIKEVK